MTQLPGVLCPPKSKPYLVAVFPDLWSREKWPKSSIDESRRWPKGIYETASRKVGRIINEAGRLSTAFHHAWVIFPFWRKRGVRQSFESRLAGRPNDLL